MKGRSDRPLPWSEVASHECGNLWHIMAADGTPVAIVFKKYDVHRILEQMNGESSEVREARAIRSAIIQIWRKLHEKTTTREQLVRVVRKALFPEGGEDIGD